MDVKTQTETDAISEAIAAPEKSKDNWLGFLVFLAKVILAVVIFRIFLFSPFSIPSESMLPQLWRGDYLLAAKWPYGYSRHSIFIDTPLGEGRALAGQPERGDLVIFKHPVDQQDYIKRVIALPGDTIGVVGGQIVLNGELVPRERIDDFDIPLSANTVCAWGGDEIRLDDSTSVCRYRRFQETLPSGVSYEVLDFGLRPSHDDYRARTVPEGHMFVMGDNRDASQDSRFKAVANDGVGMVPQDLLVGRAAILMWSTDGSAEWHKPWTWFTATRWSRIGTVL
ncbi:MAG: signal peptidase I [Pseudomonadota bacterium]